MRINYDFLDFEAFLAVKETGSFHLASERLNLSQYSVTRRVQKLEGALGSVLFDRTTREVRPTLAAKRLQQRAEAILLDACETTLAMRGESPAYTHQRAQTEVVLLFRTVLRLG
ncbi:LysR family transcriptional regulator [Sulfitobacter sp.]|uniref:LysR family transcriptional regulator n=1 Tax=Sulfitobacter sp. TaxID=1903071 RepID=UPI003002976D